MEQPTTEAVALSAPVDVSGGGVSMRATVVRLLPDAAFVKSLLTPKVGALVRLRLALPGGQQVELVAKAGKLQLAGDRGGDSGFWATFEELTPEGRATLEAAIQAAGHPTPTDTSRISRSGDTGRVLPQVSRARAAPLPTPPPMAPVVAEGQRRAAPRLPTHLEVTFLQPKQFLQAYADDLSKGGMFLITDARPALDSQVELSIGLPDGGPPAVVHARVVHHGSDTHRGVGLVFLETPGFLSRLDRCLDALLAAAG